MAFCTSCGANVPDNVKFCTGCGATMTAQPQSAQEQPKAPSGNGASLEKAQPDCARPQPAPPPTPAYMQPPDAPPKSGLHPVVGTFGWLGSLILMAIPLVGLIVCFVWAFGAGNPNRRNFARACLILTVIGVAISLAFTVLALPVIKEVSKPYMEQIDQLKESAGGLSEMADQFKKANPKK